ncbi:MAG: site-2 protease family protein [Planctomycetota bacterium]|jgi:Zn-dependent protease
MFGKRIPLFKLFGFNVQMHTSLLVLALFITWSLATSVFPDWFEGFSIITYWLMGIAGAVGLLISIVFHEFCHSIVARSYGLPMRGITLFIFGGVAEMKHEPPSAKAEFMMAIAGPLSSFLLAVLLFQLIKLINQYQVAAPIANVLKYLALLNIVLACFNLLPGFPLDGGRILRSILWGIKKDLIWATRIATGLGSTFGVILIVFGITIAFIDNDILGGLWVCLIGMFLRGASKTSYKQLLLRHRLEKQKVRSFLKSEPICAPASITIEELVRDYFYKYQQKIFGIINNNQLLVGCVTIDQIKQVPKEQWSVRSVGEITQKLSYKNTITADADALEALSSMTGTRSKHLIVVEEGQVIGTISLEDMLKLVSLKMELEGKR